MSTRTTRRASSFSASRCAAVAPTFPAPTTVILFTIPVFLLIEAGNLSGSHSQSYRTSSGLSRQLARARAVRRLSFEGGCARAAFLRAPLESTARLARLVGADRGGLLSALRR